MVIEFYADLPPQPGITTRRIEFNQGGYGDCQTLVVCNAIDKIIDEKGQEAGEAYLRSMVKQEANGMWTVQFPGLDRPVRVSPQELSNTGLSDVTLSTNAANAQLLPVLEMAYLRVHAQDQSVSDPFRLLLGKETPVYAFEGSAIGSGFADHLLSQGNGGRDLVVNAYITNKDAPAMVITSDDPSQTLKLPQPHAYTLLMRDGEYFIQNPHNTSQTFRLSEETVKNTFTDIIVAPGPNMHISIPDEYKDVARASAQYGDAKMQTMSHQGPFSFKPAIAPPPGMYETELQAKQKLRQEVANSESYVSTAVNSVTSFINGLRNQIENLTGAAVPEPVTSQVPTEIAASSLTPDFAAMLSGIDLGGLREHIQGKKALITENTKDRTLVASLENFAERHHIGNNDGKLTRAEIEAIQETVGAKKDGLVGKETLTKLESTLMTEMTPSATPSMAGIAGKNSGFQKA